MKITFIGTGYVGLVSGVMMSHLGHEVTCLDLDLNKILMLQRKESPIFEPQLAGYLEKYANTERLKFVSDYNDSVADSDCVFITVGTPPLSTGDADLTGIYAALDICSYLKEHCIIVVKSTVPPGTCRDIQSYIYAKGYNNKVVSNPEFLREGAAVGDFLKPDRIVIGSDVTDTYAIMRKIYKPITDNNVVIVETDLTTAELIKYASNAFLANKIAFINEMADLCETLEADVDTLANGIGTDKRIGEGFLKVGPGFGGSCFPKDILALQKLAQKMDSDFLILDAVIKSNNNRPKVMINKIKECMGGALSGRRLAILGLTYKAGTDDLRNSPAIELINILQNEGADIVAYDPEGMRNVPKYFEKLECANSIMEAIHGVDGIIIATEWNDFVEMDLSAIKPFLKRPLIIDLRNILNAKQVVAEGFEYHSIGRAKNANLG